MTSAFLPEPVQRGSALLIFAVAVLMVAAHATVASLAASRSTLGPRARVRLPGSVAAFLAIWLAAALVLVDRAALSRVAGGVPRFTALAVSFGPMFLGTALLWRSRTLRALNDAVPPEWLIWLQSYRMIGLMLLFPFLYFGVVPAGFAIPAAVGDVLTGLAAPWVGSAVARRHPGAIGRAIAWNLFGILDLLVAPTAAVLTQAKIFELYPLVLVPLFLGPPLGILTHVFSLRSLTRAARTERSAAGPLGEALRAG